MQDLNAYIAKLKATPQLAELLAPLFDLVAWQRQRIEELEAQVSDLQSQVRTLQNRLDQNSTNSHKPPSSDLYKKTSPGLPRLKGRKPGGQPGHKGDTLKMISEPDHIEVITPEQCCCGCSLAHIEKHIIERRQVFDLPEPRLEVTEYQLGACSCPDCGRLVRATFPEEVPAAVQYGFGVRSLVVLLSVGYTLSYQKISRLFVDLFGQAINVATVVDAQKQCFEQLAQSQRVIQEKLLQASVVHFDETGLRVAGSLDWLHSASNSDYTDLFVHRRRGLEAMKTGLLARYHSSPLQIRWALHDCYASYFRFSGCRHAICGAHLLRELRAEEEQGRVWARYMKRYLMALYRMTDSGKSVLSGGEQVKALGLYRSVLEMADEEEPPAVRGARGRPKSTKGRNLLHRLQQHEEAVLAFAFDKEVPFTNNQAERDLRPAKLKQKVSGCFRTLAGAQVYARIEGFLSTARKQGRNVFKELTAAFSGQTFLTAPKGC
jgi:transposase